MDQLKIDVIRFSDLLSKYTGISKTKIDTYLNSNPVNNIFEHTASLDISENQKRKLEELRELRNLYNTMKLSDGQRYVLDSSTKAGEYFKAFFEDMKEREFFACAFLNSRNEIINTKIMFQGSVTEAHVYPREILKEALIYDANSVAFSHNHPGGSCQPSNPDLTVTKLLKEAFDTVNIKVLDHIIVAGDRYYSFAEMGDLSVMEKPMPYISNTNGVSYESVIEKTGRLDKEDISYALTELSKFEQKFNVPASESLVSKYGDYGIFSVTDEDIISKVKEYRMIDNKNINYTDILKSVTAAKESIEGTLHFNDLTVNLVNGDRITVSYQGDNNFLIDKVKTVTSSVDGSSADISDRIELKSPSRVSDYLWKLDIQSVTDLKTELLTNNNEKSISESKDQQGEYKKEIAISSPIPDETFTGIKISDASNSKNYNIEIKFDSFNKGYSDPFLDDDSMMKGNNVVASFFENGEQVYVTRHDKNNLIKILQTLPLNEVTIKFNNPEYLQKDMREQYNAYKEELAQYKKKTAFIEKERARLLTGEKALENYEHYSEQLKSKNSGVSRIKRFFSKGEKSSYELVVKKVNQYRNEMARASIAGRGELEEQKQNLSNLIGSNDIKSQGISDLTGKMGILSSLLQQIAKSSFMENTPTLSQHMPVAAKHKVRSLAFENEMEI